MNDRELLEMAAKAAGYDELRWSMLRQCFFDRSGVYWRPLDDDGDALRLAVDLGLQFYGREIGASVEGYAFVDEADCRGDKYLAARRAIVLAAAEIGRRKK